MKILPILIAALLVAPAAAAAETVAPDPHARQVTALGGVVVWVSGSDPAKLMQRSPGGTIAPVAGTSAAAAYRNPDLGRDAGNRLVLTYARCATLTRCTYVRDDLRGNRTIFKGLAPKRCALSATPAVWRSSVGYALACFKRNRDGIKVYDGARSGLFLKKGASKPRRFAAPFNARRTGSLTVDDVDLRGGQIAASYADVAEYVIVQKTDGSRRYSERAALSEGDGEQSAVGLTIGTGDVRLWFLTRSSYAGTNARAIIHRHAGGCTGYQSLVTPDGPNREWDYPYIDLTADNGTVYAVDAGVGIVRHTYQETAGC